MEKESDSDSWTSTMRLMVVVQTVLFSITIYTLLAVGYCEIKYAKALACHSLHLLELLCYTILLASLLIFLHLLLIFLCLEIFVPTRVVDFPTCC